jgi:hypothetical protein
MVNVSIADMATLCRISVPPQNQQINRLEVCWRRRTLIGPGETFGGITLA